LFSYCFKQSTGTASHVRWSPCTSLPSIDATFTWSWTSICGRARIEIPLCQQVIYITHPIQVSRLPAKLDDNTNIPTKYIHIFAPVRRCFSLERLPDYLARFVSKCLVLIDQLSTKTNNVDNTDDNDWHFELPLPLPSTSCARAHRHRLHHQMMLESDLHILQTANITYRIEYDQPARIEAFVIDDNEQYLTEYVRTSDIQSSFYHHYSIKDQVMIC
jgi:hypothetical protein